MNTQPTARTAAVATLPATPRKVVLSTFAKQALTTAEMRNGGYFYLSGTWCLMEKVTAELASLHLVDDMGTGNACAARFVVTANGLRMRTWLQRQFYLGKLAEQVRAEGIDGEDLADLAAGIDAGEETGTITGTSIDFQLAFALAASITDQSAQDLRAELETYMGWRD